MKECKHEWSSGIDGAIGVYYCEKCGQPKPMTPTPKEECTKDHCEDCRLPYEPCTCKCHSTPTTDWRERFDERFPPWRVGQPNAGSRDMEMARVKFFIESELARTRQQTKKEIIEWAKSPMGATAVDSRSRRYIELTDLLTYLKEK